MKTKFILLCAIMLAFISTFAVQNSYLKEKMKYTIGINKIKKEKLIEAKSIEGLLDGFPKNEWEIVNYKMTIVEKGKDLAEFDGNKNQLSQAMKERIKHAASGTKIYFEYIACRLKNINDKSTRSFPPGSFILIEK